MAEKRKEGVAWDVDGELDHLQVRIRSVSKNLGDLNHLFKMIENRYVSYMEYGFATEGSSMLGRRWKKLGKDYIAWKRSKGYSTKIGVKTGRMKGSLTGGQGYIRRLGKYKATFGQLPGYAPHTEHFRKKRPIKIKKSEMEKWRKLARQYVVANVAPISKKGAHTANLGQGVTAKFSKDGRAVSYRDPVASRARAGRMRSRFAGTTKPAGWSSRL